MPRGRLNEKYVQRTAVNWLESHYRAQQDVQGVIGEMEVGVRSKSELGSGRADGLIVAQRTDGKIHTASLEAKSSRTFFNIVPTYKDEKWLLHAILVGLIGLLVARYVGWLLNGWFWVWIFPVLVFIAVAFAYLIVTYDVRHYRLIDVIAQVKRYPADERWIAISTDVYNRLNENQETLRRDCQREGIGLIRVSGGELVNCLEIPKMHRLPKGYNDFLVCYAREKLLRNKLRATILEQSERDNHTTIKTNL